MESAVLSNSGATERLDGIGNWTAWKFQLTVLLKALKLFGIVDETDAMKVKGLDADWL